MKFAWLLILLTTISSSANASADDAHEDIKNLGKYTSPIEDEKAEKNNLCDTAQPNFFDHFFNYSEQTISASIAYTPHALRFILGVSCLCTKNQDLTYALMRASGVAWLLYHFKVGVGDHFTHETDTPLMESIYLKSFIYSGLAYATSIPYFTHIGALHVTHNAFSYWRTPLRVSKKTK